jgi:hypothetical protein
VDQVERAVGQVTGRGVGLDELYAEEAGQLFDAIGVRPGIAAIDVGCGVMGVGLSPSKYRPDAPISLVSISPREPQL